MGKWLGKDEKMEGRGCCGWAPGGPAPGLFDLIFSTFTKDMPGMERDLSAPANVTP